MNSDHLPSDSAPGLACDAFDTLFTQHLLTPEADQAFHLHVMGCATCRARLAAYEHLDRSLRRQVAHFATTPSHTEDILHAIQSKERFAPQGPSEAVSLRPLALQSEAPAPPLRRQGVTHRPFTWLAALAAVLVIMLLTTALFVSYYLAPGAGNGADKTQPTAPLSMYVSTPTDATPGSASTTTYGLTALDASTGQVRWHYNNGPVPIRTDALEGEVLYADSGDGQIFAFRTSDGKRLWSFQALQQNTSVKVMQGVVYVGSDDGKTIETSSRTYTYALDATSGKERWRFTHGSALVQVSDGAIYVSGGSGTTLILYALNASDGSVKWALQRPTPIWSMWQAAGGVVYITQFSFVNNTPGDKALVALDAGTGKQLWSFPEGGSIDPQLPVLLEGVIYLTATTQGKDRLYAIDARSGRVYWQTSLNGAMIAGALLNQGVLYVNLGMALDANTGKLLWQSASDAAGSPAALVDGVLYGSTNELPTNWNIFAVNAVDGSLKWQRKIDGHSVLHIDAVLNGVIYADLEALGWPKPTTSHGVAYAFNAANGSMRWRYDLGASGMNAPPLIG